MNSVNIIGNLASDPEKRTTTNGTSVCDFRIAVNDGYGDKKRAHFFTVTCWSKVADSVAQYCSKGKKVSVSGSLQQDTWEKDGEKRSTVVINARDVGFLSSPSDEGGRQESKPESKQAEGGKKTEKDEDGLPF